MKWSYALFGNLVLVTACGASSATPSSSPETSSSSPTTPADSSSSGKADAADTKQPAASSSAPPTSSATPASPANGLTKSQLEEASASVALGLKDPYDSAYKKVVAKLGKEQFTETANNQLYWYGADSSGKCWAFSLSNMARKASNGGLESTKASNCKK